MAQSEVGSKLDIASATANAMDVAELVARCREVWGANQSRDLEARHELGKLLNDRLGSPEERQKYGTKAAQEVADDLKMSRSELSRMRQFAAQYPDFDAFRKRKPNCTNWSQVKQALVKSGAKKCAPRATAAKSPVDRLTRRLRDVRMTIENEATFREAGASPEFREQLQALVEAAGRYLQPESQLS